MALFKQKIYVPLILLIIISIISLVYFLKINNKSQNTSNENPVSSVSKQSESNSLSEDPFYKLTIPYLREREYASQLNEKALIDSNDDYSTYLTSYDSDGLKINGLLTIPSDEQPVGGWPAVVFIHGYIPPDQYQTTQKYEEYVSYLAKNGLVVFKIDLRGHGNSEGSAGGAYFSSDYIIDTLNARAAINEESFVNKDKVGLWGHSMAGNVVLRSLVAQPDIPTVVIWAGAVYTYQDMQDLGISDNSYQRPSADSPRTNERENLFNTHERSDLESEFWNAVIPTNYLKQVTGAIQLHHAINDSVVNIEYSRNLNKILDDTNIQHQLLEYNSGGHNISGASFTKAMESTVDFYKREM